MTEVEESPLVEKTVSEQVDQEVTKATNKVIETTSDKTPWARYAIIGLCVLVLLYAIYYIYCRFMENSVAEPFVQGQERSDTVTDYNLHEAVEELQSMQKKILSKLSQMFD